MKKLYAILITVVFAITFGAGAASAMQGAQHDGGHGAGHGGDHGGAFKHMAQVDGIDAEFQVMSLESMNMSDPDGNTHHVMALFSRGDEKITKMVGKVKLIAPSGKEQVADLKDYGGGNFAANFLVDEDGKWGVICLFKDMEGQHTVKFWYPHGGH